MKRAIILLTGAILLVATGLLVWRYTLDVPTYPDRGPSFWLAWVLPGVLLCAAIGFFVWGSSDNIYNVHEGQVIDHSFVEAHTTMPTYIPGQPATQNSPGTAPIYMPGHRVPDDWALLVRDPEGHEGWLHFGENVFKNYPIGSYYTEEDS